MNNKSLFPSSLFSSHWKTVEVDPPCWRRLHRFWGCLYDWTIGLQAKLVSGFALDKTRSLTSSRWRNHMGLGSSLSPWRQDGVLFPNQGSPRAWLRNQPGVQLVAWTCCWVKLGRGGGRWQVTASQSQTGLCGGATASAPPMLDPPEAAAASAQQPAKFPSRLPSQPGAN